MRYRILGDTGLRISTYSLGSVMFGSWGNDDEDRCAAMVRRALDAGINLVDTADVYGQGQAERIIGKAIRGRRDEVLLATKFHAPMGTGPNERGNSRAWIMQAVEASLRRLDTDHIDLYQLHRPDPDTSIDETLGALEDLVTQGKVRYAGTSTFPAWQLVAAQSGGGRMRFVSEQAPYSLLVRSIERDVLPVAAQYRLGVLVWSPLAGGWLAGRYRRDAPPPRDTRAGRVREYEPRGGRMAERYDLNNDANDAKFTAVEALTELASECGIALIDLSLAFTLSHPAVTSTIIGPRTPEQLDAIIAGADTQVDDATLDAIDAIIAPGSVLNPADLGWDPPWMSAAVRRARPVEY